MKDVKKLLKWNSERMRQGEVVLVPTFYGKSGVGKTWRAKALYRELRTEQPDLLWARLLPGTMLPEEALGLPKVTEKETIWTAPSWAVKGQPVFLFVDELDKARPETLGALLTLFAEGRIRDFPLPPGSMILAAMQPVNRAEWLADETGEAMGARLTYIPIAPEWTYLESKHGLAPGALSFLPTPKELALPVVEEPTARQIDWCLSVLKTFGSEGEPFVRGTIPAQFVEPLKQALGESATVSPESLLKALQEDPSKVAQLSISELIAILPESWFTTPDLMTAIYKQILIRGNPEDITSAQESIYNYLKEKCEENGGSCEIFPGYDDPQVLVDALNNMAREVGHEWMKRRGDNAQS